MSNARDDLMRSALLPEYEPSSTNSDQEASALLPSKQQHPLLVPAAAAAHDHLLDWVASEPSPKAPPPLSGAPASPADAAIAIRGAEPAGRRLNIIADGDRAVRTRGERSLAGRRSASAFFRRLA